MLNNYDDFAVVPKVRTRGDKKAMNYLNGKDISGGIAIKASDLPNGKEFEVITIEESFFNPSNQYCRYLMVCFFFFVFPFVSVIMLQTLLYLKSKKLQQ